MEILKECLICSAALGGDTGDKYFAIESKSTLIFLLESILEISNSICSKILSKHRKNSASLLSFCKNCFHTVLEAERLFKEFTTLEARWKALKKELVFQSVKASKIHRKSKTSKDRIIEIIKKESTSKNSSELSGDTSGNFTDEAEKDVLQEVNPLFPPHLSLVKVEHDSDHENCDQIDMAVEEDHNRTDDNLLVQCKSEIEDFDGENSSNEHGCDNSEELTSPISDTDETKSYHTLRKRKKTKKYSDFEINDSEEDALSNQDWNPDLHSDSNLSLEENEDLANISWKRSSTDKKKSKCKKGKFPCEFCSKISSSPIQLKDHQRRSHGVKHKFQCKFCKRVLSNGYTLLRHIYSVHKQKPQKTAGSYGIKSLTENQITEKIDEDDASKSEHFSTKLSSEESMAQDIEIGEYPCDFCPKTLTTLATKMQHERYAHKIKHEFKCDKCFKRLSNGYTLLRHIQSVHNETKKQERRRIRTLRKIQIKLDSGLPLSSSVDNECESNSGSNISNSDAIAVDEDFDDDAKTDAVLQDSEIGEFVCEFCPNVSNTLLKKKLHEWRTHNFKHTFQCSQCSKCLANGYTLLRHIRSVHIRSKMKKRKAIAKIKRPSNKNDSKSSGIENVVDADDVADFNSLDNEEAENGCVMQESEPGSFVCSYCPTVSKTLLKKKLHESRAHGVSHTFQCRKCKKVLANGYTLQRHIESVHIKKTTRPKKYKKRNEDISRSESSLPLADTENISDEKPMDSIPGPADLTALKDCEIGIFTCDHCPIISSTLLKKKQHERWAHGIKHTFQCPSCQKCLANGYTLLRHFLSVHSKNKKRKKKCRKDEDATRAARKVMLKYDSMRSSAGVLKCQHCGKLCASLEKKNDHENRAHGESHKFLCEHCPKYFLKHDTFERHVFNMHPTTIGEQNESSNANSKYANVIIFKCTTCGQICKSAAKLAQHVRKIHESERTVGGRGKKFLCQQCGKNFPSCWGLRNHEFRVHHIEVPFPCTLCKRNYLTETKLQEHIAFCHESNQVPVNCQECTKTFPTIITLRKHMARVHRRDRNYNCEICSEHFETHPDLQVHQRIHHQPQNNNSTTEQLATI